MASVVSIRGLDLVLGGGLPGVRKLDDQRESTVVLVRGAAGAGKTIFASHLAISEAAQQEGDVVYCCIELLPTELEAQLSNLTFGPEGFAARVTHVGSEAPPVERPRILASIVDVPSEGLPDFGGEIKRSLDAARSAGLEPRVLVIDSLSEGYRLGGGVFRPLADALSKFAAEEGLVLVLIEEVAHDRDSLWTFVADVVFELSHHGAPGTASAEHRSLLVRKSRFGPSHVGPHGFAIRPDGGIEIYPRISNYLAHSVRQQIPRDVSDNQTVHWNVKDKEGRLQSPKPGEVFLVTGGDAAEVSIVAALAKSGVATLRLNLDRIGFKAEDEMVLYCGDPLMSSELLMSMFWQRLHVLKGRISAIVVGDLDSIRGHCDPAAIRQALPVLVWLAHEAGLEVLLFETCAEGARATAIHLADTIIEVRRAVSSSGTTMTLSLTSPKRGLVGRALQGLHLS
jgi:KaiC/GvpD/RAD55 family RecA-like ATPase